MSNITFNKKKWFGVIGLLFLFGFFFSVTNYFQPPVFALISSVFDTLMLFLVYQITVGFLFPRYYHQGWSFLLISAVVILVFTFIYFYIDMSFIPRVENSKFQKPPLFFHFMRTFMVTGFIFFVGTSISLMEHNNRLIENEKMLTREKLETELKLLKAQIDPHFIFNALNNIYSLTYLKAKNAPEAVLKLSEMLRYVFYECSKDRVPLSSEIKYMENFSAFQQMKSDYSQNISLETHIDSGNAEMAPMLFIPFLENAFKYSRIEEIEDAWVRISLDYLDKKIHFFIENSIPDQNLPSAGSGTGIKNVRHRLDIIYPEKHKLDIFESDTSYSISLNIEV